MTDNIDNAYVISELEARGFQYRDDYLTNDICFDYEGCDGYPLSFHDWSGAAAFLEHLKNWEPEIED